MELDSHSSPEVDGLQCTAADSFRVLFECDFCEGMFHSVRALRAHRYKVHGIHSNAEVMVDVDHVDCQMDTIHAGGFTEDDDVEDEEEHPVMPPSLPTVVHEPKPIATGVPRNTAKKRSYKPKQKISMPTADARNGETVSPVKAKKGKGQKVGLAKRRLNFSAEKKKLSLNAGSLFSGPNTDESDIPLEMKTQSRSYHKSDHNVQSANVYQRQNSVELASPVQKFPQTAPVLPVAGLPSHTPVYSQLSPTLKPVQHKTKTKERLKKNLHTSPNKVRAVHKPNPPTSAPLLQVPDHQAPHNSPRLPDTSERKSPQPQSWTPESPRIPKVRLTREHKSGMYQVQLFDIPPTDDSTEISQEDDLAKSQIEVGPQNVQVREHNMPEIDNVENPDVLDSIQVQTAANSVHDGSSLKNGAVPSIKVVSESLVLPDQRKDFDRPESPKESLNASNRVESPTCSVALSRHLEATAIISDLHPQKEKDSITTVENLPELTLIKHGCEIITLEATFSKSEPAKIVSIPQEELQMETVEEGVSEADMSHFDESRETDKVTFNTEIGNKDDSEIATSSSKGSTKIENVKTVKLPMDQNEHGHEDLTVRSVNMVKPQTGSTPEEKVVESSAVPLETCETTTVDGQSSKDEPVCKATNEMDAQYKLIKNVSVKLVDIKSILSKCSAATNEVRALPAKAAGPTLSRRRRGPFRQAIQKKQPKLPVPQITSVSEIPTSDSGLAVMKQQPGAKSTGSVDMSRTEHVKDTDSQACSTDVPDTISAPSLSKQSWNASAQSLSEQSWKGRPRGRPRKKRNFQVQRTNTPLKKQKLLESSISTVFAKAENEEKTTAAVDSVKQNSEKVTSAESLEQLPEEFAQKPTCQVETQQSVPPSRKRQATNKIPSQFNLASTDAPPTTPKLRKKSAKLEDSIALPKTNDQAASLSSNPALETCTDNVAAIDEKQLPQLLEPSESGNNIPEIADDAILDHASGKLVSGDKFDDKEGSSMEQATSQKKGFTCSFCGKVYKVAWHFRVHESKHTADPEDRMSTKLQDEPADLSSKPAVAGGGPSPTVNGSQHPQEASQSLVAPTAKRPLVCLSRSNVSGNKHGLFKRRWGKRGKSSLDVYDFTDDSADDRKVGRKSAPKTGKQKMCAKVIGKKHAKNSKLKPAKYRPSPIKLSASPDTPKSSSDSQPSVKLGTPLKDSQVIRQTKTPTKKGRKPAKVHWKRRQKLNNIERNSTLPANDEPTASSVIPSGEDSSKPEVQVPPLKEATSLPITESKNIEKCSTVEPKVTDSKLMNNAEELPKGVQEFAAESLRDDFTPEKDKSAVATPDTGLSTGSDISSDISSEQPSLHEVDISEHVEEASIIELSPCKAQVQLTSHSKSQGESKGTFETEELQGSESSAIRSPLRQKNPDLKGRRRPSQQDALPRAADDGDDDIGYHSSGSCEQMSHDSSMSMESTGKSSPVKRRSSRLSKPSVLDLPGKSPPAKDSSLQPSLKSVALSGEKMVGLFKMPHVPKESIPNSAKDTVTATCQHQPSNPEVAPDPGEDLGLVNVLIKTENDAPVLLSENLMSKETADDIDSKSGVARSFLDSFLSISATANTSSPRENAANPQQALSKLSPESFPLKHDSAQSKVINFAAKLDVFKMKLQKGSGKSTDTITSQDAPTLKSSAPKKKAAKNKPDKKSTKSEASTPDKAPKVDSQAPRQLSKSPSTEIEAAKDCSTDDTLPQKDENSRSVWDSVFPDLFSDKSPPPKCQEPPTLILSETSEDQPNDIPKSAPRLIPEPHLAPALSSSVENMAGSAFGVCSCRKNDCQRCYMQRCTVTLERQLLGSEQMAGVREKAKDTLKETPKTQKCKSSQEIINAQPRRESLRKKKSTSEAESKPSGSDEAAEGCHGNSLQALSEGQGKLGKQQGPHRNSKGKIPVKGKT